MGNKKTVFDKTIDGAKWMSYGLIVQRIINIITFVTLARILTPEMYGIMIAATLVVGIATTFLTSGFSTVLIQEKKDAADYIDTIWTFEVIKGLILLILVVACTPWIAQFFQVEGYEAVIWFGGFFLFIMGFGNIAQLYVFKEIEFKKIFVRDMVSQGSFLVVALTWAIISPSVWALVAGNTAMYVSSTIMSYVIYPYMPRFNFQFGKLRSLIGKSKWIMGTNAVTYLSSIIDTTFLGYLLGPASMGIYSKARDVAIIPSSTISQITKKVGFPAIAKIQDKEEQLEDGLSKMIDMTLLISLPFLLVLLFEANRIVPLFLGQQWVEMVGPLKLLVVAMTIGVFSRLADPIFTGIGRFDIQFKVTLIQVIVTAGGLVYLVPKYGADGAAIAVIASFVAIFLYVIANMTKVVKVKITKTISSLAITVGSAALTIGMAIPFHHYLRSMHGILYLVMLSMLGLVYLGFVLGFGRITNRGPYVTIRRVLQSLKK